MERYGECDGLLKVGKEEIVDENDVLVVSDVLLVEFPPGYHSVGNEDQKCRY